MPELHCGASIGDVEIRPHLATARSNMMVGKRARDIDSDDDLPPLKRGKSSISDRLSSLSDELTLRVLSFLPVAQLVKCQRYVVLLSMPLSLTFRVAEESDCRISTTLLLEIANYGNHITTTASSGRGRADCPDSKTWNNALKVYILHRKRRDG